MLDRLQNTARVLFGFAILLFVTATLRADENWAQFRGPGNRGVSANEGLPDTWSKTKNVVWKTGIAGRGWSSPIVWQGKIFVTTVVNEGETEKIRLGLYFGGDRPLPPESNHLWKVVCVSLESGDIVWEQTVHSGVPATPRHLKNSYASETPVTDGENVYAYFGNVGLFCLSLDGRPVWEKRFPAHKMRNSWGTAASPVLHGDRLYIVNDNHEASFLLALDKKTGGEIWRTDREEKSNWATPYVWENELRTEIITPGTGRIRSYDMAGGLLYELEGASSITIATPYSHDGLLYVSSGYVMSSRKPLFAIRPGATGDISLKDDQTENQFIAWCQKKGAPYNPSTLLYDGLVYVLHDRGYFACFDAKTGEEVYKRLRLSGIKGAFTASPWAYDGKIFCLNEYGETCVIRAGREYKMLHKNSLGSGTLAMATPAISGRRLILRTSGGLYCIEQSE